MEEIQELLKKINDLITPQGILVSGNGIICEDTKKIIERLDKIEKFIYFLEKRQKEMFDYMKEKK